MTLDECEHNMYTRCNHQSEFSQLELENARRYLQDHMRKADFPPTQPPCKRLFVRKDIKCLTESEKTEFVRVIRQMYLRGVMGRIASVHQRYWPETHKAAEFSASHRWINHLLEKEMRKISPGITLPYYVSLKNLILINFDKFSVSTCGQSTPWKVNSLADIRKEWCPQHRLLRYGWTVRRVIPKSLHKTSVEWKRNDTTNRWPRTSYGLVASPQVIQRERLYT